MESTDDYTPHIIPGLAKAVRHYNLEYILNLKDISKFQKEALESEIRIDFIWKYAEFHCQQDVIILYFFHHSLMKSLIIKSIITMIFILYIV